MRRRRLLAALGGIGALAGCLGGSGENREEPMTTANREWDPAPGEAGTPPNGTEPPDAGTGTERSGSTVNGTGAAPAFENGTGWEADRAQVAADDPEAGAAVEFALETAPLRSCGRACRELRAALTNTGTDDAHDVSVRTELTSGDELVREREERVGDLPAGETYRASARVELGVLEAVRVRDNGAVLIEQVVTSEQRREVFEREVELSA
jgi:hypothetical protein